MISLLKKDLLIQKKSFIFAMVYAFFLFILFNNPVFGETLYIMGMVITVYFFLITANMEDEKNKSEIVLNSLPVNRGSIVLAKYLSVFIYIFIGAVFLGLGGLFFQIPAIPITPRLLQVADLLAVIILISIAVSIYFPLYFRFGAAALRFFSVVFFLFFFFVPRWLFELYFAYEGTETVRLLKDMLEQSPLLPALLVLAAAFIMLAASFLLSNRIYRQKEF